MIFNIFKVIWNRKSKNTFIAIEMFVLFILVFGSGYFLAEKINVYLIPDNYETHNRIMLQMVSNTAGQERYLEDMEKLSRNLSFLPGVKMVGKAVDGPLVDAYTSSRIKADSIETHAQFRGADVNLNEVLGFQMAEGSWYKQEEINLYVSVFPFSESSEGMAIENIYAPIVINRLLAEKLFGDNPATGKIVIARDRSCRVTGVVEPVKRFSFEKPEPTIFFPTEWPLKSRRIELYLHVNDPRQPGLMEQISHRIFTTVDKETWSISTLASMEARKNRNLERERVDLVLIIFLALFLLFTALLGLTGIFSYNINKRKPEMGVLLAVGSTQHALQWRLVMEMVFVSLLGIVPAIFILAQIPLLKVFPMDSVFYYQALLGIFLFIVAMVILFAWYPAMKASRMEPAQALKEE